MQSKDVLRRQIKRLHLVNRCISLLVLSETNIMLVMLFKNEKHFSIKLKYFEEIYCQLMCGLVLL